MKESRDEFTKIEGLAIFLGMIGIQLCSEVVASWGNYFYSPPEGGRHVVYVSAGLAWIIFTVGRVWDFAVDPFIGIWSDTTPARPGRWRIPRITGRRRPFIFWGSALLILTNVAFWWPPVQGESTLNLVFGSVIITLHWIFFSLCFIALYALGPEIARSAEARVRLGVWMGSGLLAGLFLAQVVPGVLIEALDPARADGAASAAGFRRTAVLVAVISFALFQAPVWLIRERYDSDVVLKRDPIFQGIGEALQTRHAWFYMAAFFFLSLGQLAVQVTTPHWVEVGLGGSEATVSKIMLPFILTAAITIALMHRFGHGLPLKWLMLISWAIAVSGFPPMYFVAVADLDSDTKVTLAAVIYGWSGIGLGMFYVLIVPLTGQLIDFNARRTGRRREALYNGIHGFSIQSAQALAIAAANLSMAQWGNSAESPDGIYYVPLFATAMGIISLVVILGYPKFDDDSVPANLDP